MMRMRILAVTEHLHYALQTAVTFWLHRVYMQGNSEIRIQK